jgi:hypothetical protein
VGNGSDDSSTCTPIPEGDCYENPNKNASCRIVLAGAIPRCQGIVVPARGPAPALMMVILSIDGDSEH